MKTYRARPDIGPPFLPPLPPTWDREAVVVVSDYGRDEVEMREALRGGGWTVISTMRKEDGLHMHVKNLRPV